jgi:hypothetical protein
MEFGLAGSAKVVQPHNGHCLLTRDILGMLFLLEGGVARLYLNLKKLLIRARLKYSRIFFDADMVKSSCQLLRF